MGFLGWGLNESHRLPEQGRSTSGDALGLCRQEGPLRHHPVPTFLGDSLLHITPGSHTHFWISATQQGSHSWLRDQQRSSLCAHRDFLLDEF